MNTHAALFVGGVFPPRFEDLVDQFGNAQNVLVGLCGQAQHKVELDVVPAAFKRGGTGLQDLRLRHILVDSVAQALGTGLRRKGQTALAHLLQPQHQVA